MEFSQVWAHEAEARRNDRGSSRRESRLRSPSINPFVGTPPMSPPTGLLLTVQVLRLLSQDRCQRHQCRARYDWTKQVKDRILTPLRHDEATPPRRSACLTLGLRDFSSKVEAHCKEPPNDACTHDRATACEGKQADHDLSGQGQGRVSEVTRVHRLIPFSASAASIFWSFHRW